MGINLSPRAQAVVLLALVGTLGILIGIGVDRLLAGPEPARVEAPGPRPFGPRWGVGPSGPPGAWRRGGPPERRFSDQLAEELELTPEQKAAIDSILTQDQARVRELMQEYGPRFGAIVEDTRRKIDAVLTEEQRARFRELREERMREWGDSGPPPPWGGRGRAWRGETVPGGPR